MSNLGAQSPTSKLESLRKDLNETSRLSRQFGGRGDWKMAGEQLQTMGRLIQEIKSIEPSNTEFDHWYWQEELTIAQTLRNMVPGQAAFQYKVAVILVDETKADMISAPGKRMEPTTQKLQTGTMEATKEFFEYQRHFFRAWSKGQIEMVADYFQPGLSLRRMEESVTSVNNPDLRYLFPVSQWQKQLAGLYSQYDAFIFIWPKPQGAPATALGGDHPADLLFPGMNLDLKRGVVAIPDTWIHSNATRNTLIHEIFHTLERSLGFGPFHAWEDLNMTELAYYQWRFETLIPEWGWKNANYRNRFPWSQEQVNLKALLQFYQDNALDSLLNPGQQPRDFPTVLQDQLQNSLYEENWSQAFATSQKLLTYFPQNPDLLLKGALASAGMKKTPVARELLARLEALMPPGGFPFTFHNSLLQIVNLLGDQTEDITRLARLTPQWLYSHRLLGDRFFENGDYPQAMEFYAEALGIYPHSYRDQMRYGKALYQMGQADQALINLEKAATQSASAAAQISAFLREQAYLESSQRKRLYLYENALKLNPRDGWAARGIAMDSLSDQAKAQKFLKLSADLGLVKSIETLQEKYGITYTPVTPGTTVPSRPIIRVGIFDLHEQGETRWFDDAFAQAPWIQVSYLSPGDIRGGALKTIDTLIVPGGMANEYANALEANPQVILDFVQKGGDYIGICAGAFAAVSSKYFNIVPGEPLNAAYWYRGDTNLRLNLEKAGELFLEWKEPQVTIRYANGPLFNLEGMKEGQDYSVLARYATSVGNFGAPDLMKGRAAIILTRIGKGDVLLLGPHPEYTYGLEVWLQTAVNKLN